MYFDPIMLFLVHFRSVSTKSLDWLGLLPLLEILTNCCRLRCGISFLGLEYLKMFPQNFYKTNQKLFYYHGTGDFL
jgi:hypothetical protein